MARISTYAVDSEIVTTDKVLGTDSQGLTTKNFSFSAVKDWLNSSAVVGVVGQNTYTFQTIPGNPVVRDSGSISLPGLGGDGTAFADITSMVFSERAADNSIATNYINTLVGKQVVLMQLDNLNNFGVYNLDSFTPLQGSPGFYTAALSLNASNGNLISDRNYGFAVYGLQAEPARWGEVVGTLTDQTDLVNYVAAEIAEIPIQSTPNLDSVTDEGAVTTNTIEVGGVTSNGLVKAVADTLPSLEFYAESQTNPTANEDMGSVTFSRLFDNPDLQTLATALYNPFVVRVEADGGTVEGTAVDLRNDLDTLLAGKVATDTARMRVEYTDTAGNMSSDFVFYTTTAGLITEKFRVTKDGNIEVKEALGGVVIRSKNDTPYRILVDNDGRLEATALDAAAPVISGVPTITGFAAITETLTAVKASVTSSPALTTTYQWQVSDTGTGGWSNISGATSSSYLIPLEYANKFLRVQQIETNIIGQTTAFSAATSAVIPSLLVSAMIQRLDNFENENYVYDSLVEFDAIEI